jgi:hypothetical protein
MQITLDNLEYAPDEPFYSYILENYGEDGYFDPIEVCEKSTNSLSRIFHWLIRLDWEIINIDSVKFSKYISSYLNKNFANCTDLKLLDFILAVNLDTQTNANLEHYIKLYETQCQYTEAPAPFEVWIHLMNLKTKYWSDYFLNKINAKYSNSSLVDLICMLEDRQLKEKWIEKYITNQPNSKDFKKLLIRDETFNTFQWHKYFKQLNPSASDICRLILSKSSATNVFINKVDTNDIYWFDYYLSKKGSDLNLLIFTMFELLKNVNYNYNFEHWKRFLFYIQSDMEKIDKEINSSKNQKLKDKWRFVKKEVFNIEPELETPEFEEPSEECPF